METIREDNIQWSKVNIFDAPIPNVGILNMQTREQTGWTVDEKTLQAPQPTASVRHCSYANPAACMNNAFASTPLAQPALRAPPSPATLTALLLNLSKNRLFLQCSNTVTVPAKALNWLLCIPWTLITMLKGLSTDQGVISNSLEGRYDLMTTHGGMLITISSSDGRMGRGRHMSSIRADRWNEWLHILVIALPFDRGILIIATWEIFLNSMFQKLIHWAVTDFIG